MPSYAVGVKNGISIGGFKVNEWEAHGDKSAFNGSAVPELVNFNWKKIINSSIGFWQRGNYLIVELDGTGRFRFIHGSRDRAWKPLE